MDAADYAEKIRVAHVARMRGLMGGAFAANWDGPRGEHTDEVVKRAVAAYTGADDTPWLHEHAIEEAGLCTDCDAYLAMRDVEGDR